MNDSVIVCRQLTKKYKDTLALNQIDLQLQPNKIYGLLGRNGAGKSTLLHLLTAQILPSSGNITVFGAPPYEHGPTLSRICFIKESQQYVKHMKIKEIFQLAALFFPQWDEEFARRLTQDFQLNTNKKVGKLSRGMESTVGVIIGLASRAELTIFDEPYLGLDAAARTLFYDHLLQDFAQHPRTIILSTHLIDEVSKLFNEVIMIRAGEIVLQAETDDLRNKAYHLSGSSEQVEKWSRGKEVLHREQFGAKVQAAVYGNWSQKDKQQMAAEGLDMKPVTLQELMIYLTTVPAAQGGTLQ